MAERVFEGLLGALRPFISTITARALVESALRRQRLSRDLLDQHGITPALLRTIERGLSIYLGDVKQRNRCRKALADLVAQPIHGRPGEALGPVHIPVRSERDVVLARSRARTVAAAVGFDSTEQIKIITAVSELSRNIHAYVGEGEIILRAPSDGRRGLEIVAVDQGAGIPNLDEVLSGQYQSKTGMGLGLRGCRRLMTHFAVKTSPQEGTCVTMTKLL